jgi:competence protein ComFC
MSGQAKKSWARFLGEAVRLADLLVFPSRCRVCQELLDERGERVVCRDCLKNMRPCRESFCLCCGRFFFGEASPHLCLDCLTTRPLYTRHRSGAPYEGVLRELIVLMKYRGYRVLGKDLARFALEALGQEESLWRGLEAVIPVPLHPRKRKTRGFNQVEIIARELGRAKGLPLRGEVLRRVRNIPAQTSLDAAARKRNVAAAFAVRRPDVLRGQRVLLVDDVYTTGATIRECCRTLLRAGVREVRALTLART